ncbi:unnamed protein product [Peronospora belbahrii]|uniref:RNA exonuclease 4 n=1 Tax=Peronospora belbahrii TaxID=622444 RepID=A0ABN8DC12_9STRA|nr:unnamed protein product [Peronospora belbahrii]
MAKIKRVAIDAPLQVRNEKMNDQSQYGKRKHHKLSQTKKVCDLVLQKKQEKGVPIAKVTALANSNWNALKSKIQQKGRQYQSKQKLEKKCDLDVKVMKKRVKQERQVKRMKAQTAKWVNNSCIVAMDCEMVGVGLSGKTSVLARCSIVDYEGNVLYDKHVRPVEKVTDFRTHVSGIRSSSLRNAIPFAQCIKEVGKLIQDKIIVGHALKNDFQALMFTPPKHLIRDTAYYRPYMRRKINGTKLYPKSLKHLAEEVLGKQIQTGQHDSIEDARATLELYKQEQYAWEKHLRTSKSSSLLVGVAPFCQRKRTFPGRSLPLIKLI